MQQWFTFLKQEDVIEVNSLLRDPKRMASQTLFLETEPNVHNKVIALSHAVLSDPIIRHTREAKRCGRNI